VTNYSGERGTAEKASHASSDMGGFEDTYGLRVDAVNDTTTEGH
jgi:hypothetical protein